MIRFSHCVASAVFISMITFSAASAHAGHKGAAHATHKGAAHTKHISAGAFASAQGGPSDMDIRRQCFAEAKQRYPSMNQDVQTSRVFTYTTCAFDHGVRNP